MSCPSVINWLSTVYTYHQVATVHYLVEAVYGARKRCWDKCDRVHYAEPEAQPMCISGLHSKRNCMIHAEKFLNVHTRDTNIHVVGQAGARNIYMYK